MPTINYNAALPAFSSISGRSSIDINKWVSELKFNISSLIKSLFRNGEQGFFYDPNDLSTMFKDAAGTIPVTGVGQPVGLILDKSGRNNHARQTTSASRPILRQNATTGAYYLAFDGSDDFLVTDNIDFTSTDEVSLFAGVRKLSDSPQILAELSADSGYIDGTFYFSAGADGSIGYTSLGHGTAKVSSGHVARIATYLAPDSAVLSAKHDISGDLSSIRRNGVNGVDGLEDKGSGNFGNYPLYIGRRAGKSLPLNGHIYCLIGVGRLSTESETVAIEKELTKRTGVMLSV